jgi:hypothetical protein
MFSRLAREERLLATTKGDANMSSKSCRSIRDWVHLEEETAIVYLHDLSPGESITLHQVEISDSLKRRDVGVLVG